MQVYCKAIALSSLLLFVSCQVTSWLLGATVESCKANFRVTLRSKDVLHVEANHRMLYPNIDIDQFAIAPH